VGAAPFWEWEPRRVDKGLEVVVSDLVLTAIAADMIGDIGPRTKAVDLGALDEEQFLVGTPFRDEYREGVLLYYAVRVALGLV
jgi:hypothetical protein